MLIGVVEHQRLALGPADDAVVDAHPDGAVPRHDEAEVAGDESLGHAAVVRDVGSRRKDREERTVEAGDLAHHLRRLRAARQILVDRIAVAPQEERAPHVDLRNRAVIGRDRREAGRGLAHQRDLDRLVADRLPIVAQDLGPGEVAHVEHGIVGDEAGRGDQPVEHAPQVLADLDDDRPALLRLHRRAGRGGARDDVDVGNADPRLLGAHARFRP